MKVVMLSPPPIPPMTVRQARLKPPVLRRPIVAKYSRVLKAGAYTQITAINAPASANPGDLIMMSVDVKNTFVTSIGIACVAQVGGVDFINSGATVNWVAADQIKEFSGQYVTMPDHDMVVDAWSYFLGTDNNWYADDHMQITIKKNTLGGWQKLASQNTPVAVSQIAGWQKLATQNTQVAINQIAGWEKIATTNTPVAVAPIAGWQKLATQNVNVAVSQISNWQKLGTQDVPVALDTSLIGGWQKLGTKNVSVALDTSEIGGWKKLDQNTASLTPGFQIPSGYSLVLDQTTADGKSYSGDAQRSYSQFTFLPSSWPGAMWFTQKLIVNKLADQVQKNGQKLLTTKLYESGFSYILVLETTNTATGYRTLAPLIIAGIIVAALLVALAITIAITVHMVTDFIYKTPGAAIATGLILLGVAGAGVLGLAIWKGTSVKQAVTGKKPVTQTKTKALAAPKRA